MNSGIWFSSFSWDQAQVTKVPQNGAKRSQEGLSVVYSELVQQQQWIKPKSKQMLRHKPHVENSDAQLDIYCVKTSSKDFKLSTGDV